VRRRRWLRPSRTLRPTRAGWCFLGIIFGVGFAAMNTGNNLLYLVLSLMLAFLVLSGLLSEASLRGIRIERKRPRELFAQTSNRIVLRIHNAHRHVASFAVAVEDRILTEGVVETIGHCFALRVGPESSADRSYIFAPERRGELRFDGLRVSTRFPFGLFVKSVEIQAPESALVYPRVDPNPSALRRHEVGDDFAERPGASLRGDEVASLREFVAGDSVGRVHWRSSLRARRLLVGERDGVSASDLEVQLEIPRSTPRQVVEERIARAASEVVVQLDTGSRVGLRSHAARFPPATGFAHRTELLSFLARVEVDSGAPAAARREGPSR
jgi:uncharacterized protein (DUF58 family)